MTDSIIIFILPSLSTHLDFLHFNMRQTSTLYEIPCTLDDSVVELTLHLDDFFFLGDTSTG
jgi:hypothetical protein